MMQDQPARPRVEFPDTQPGPGAGPGEWNAYVEAGPSVESRRDRLDECPPEYRDRVRAHVQTVFAMRKHHRSA